MRINSISNDFINNKQNFGRFLDTNAYDMAKDICYTKGTGDKNIDDPDVYTMSYLDNSKLVELYTGENKKGKKVLKAKINKKYAEKRNIEYDVECERKLYRMEYDLWFRNVGDYNRLYHLGQFARSFAAHDYYSNSELHIISNADHSTNNKEPQMSDYESTEQYLRDRGMYDR